MIPDGAAHFFDFDGVTFLDCAYQGPIPRVTADEIRRVLPLKTHPNRVTKDVYFSFPDRARAAVAPLIGARPEEITIGTGASHGMGLAAVGFPWRPGDEVVLGANEFPSNIYIWAGAARRHGGRAVLVESRTKALTTDEILAAITERTRVVVASLVDFGSGEVQDLERLGSACRERGIFLAVDGTQAVGIMPVDVRVPGLSLLTVGAYKWMLAPYGTGFAWLDPAWWDRIEPSYVTWTAAEGAEHFNQLPRGNWKWAAGARRYDAPETASFMNVAGMARSAEFIASIGVERMHAHVVALLDGLERGLPRGFRRRGNRPAVPGPILVVEADDPARAHAAYERMTAANVRVSLREDGIRVSPHIYNTAEQIERVVALLDAV